MHHRMSSLLLFGSTLVISPTCAAPAPQQAASAPDSNDHTKVHLVATGSTNQKSGVLAMDQVYRKYAMNVPYGWGNTVDDAQSKVANGGRSSNINSQDVDSQGGAHLDSAGGSAVDFNNDLEYLFPVSVGNQILWLDIDTGSSDTWVFNTAMPSTLTTGHTGGIAGGVYDPSKSSRSSQLPDNTFSITYGDNSQTSGGVGMDIVQIGEIAIHQALELPTNVSDSFAHDTNSSGILGLGFRSNNNIATSSGKDPQPSFFENAFTLGMLQQPVFTANLRHNTPGYYQFGVIDHTAYSGSLQYQPIDNSQGMWQFASSYYAIGSGDKTVIPNASPAIADTGSSLMNIDPPAVEAYYAQIPRSSSSSVDGGYIFPCDADLPDFHFAIGEIMTTIPKQFVNYAPAKEPGFCFGSIQSNGGNPPQVYGDPMFKALFVVFDIKEMRLGFAPHA